MNKKFKAMIGLWLGSIALFACGSPVGVDGILLVNNGVTERVVMSRDEFNQYGKEDFGIVFEKMFNSLIQHELNSDSSYLKKQGIYIDSSEAEDEVNKIKVQANENAKEKGITFDEEIGIILNEHHVSSLDELLFCFVKQSLKDKFIAKNYESLLNRYLGKDSDYLSAYPYYMKHALLRMNLDDNGKLTHISSSDAESLFNWVKFFPSTIDTFYKVGSDDRGTKNNVIGVMDKTSTLIDELHLGTYVFDSLFYRANTVNANALRSSVFIDSTNEAFFAENGLDYVPFGVFTQLDEVKDLETRYSGSTISYDEEEDFYPRNIYFNKYFNRRNPFLISNDAVATSSDSKLSIYRDKNGKDYSKTEYDSNIMAAEAGKMGFRFIEGLSRDNDHLILTDEKSNPVYCVRSKFGIHLIAMESSPLAEGHVEFFKNLDKGYGDYAINILEKAALVAPIKDYITQNYVEWELDCFHEIMGGEMSLSFAHYDKEYDLGAHIENYFERLIQEKKTSFAKMFESRWETYRASISTINAQRKTFPKESEVFNYIQ